MLCTEPQACDDLLLQPALKRLQQAEALAGELQHLARAPLPVPVAQTAWTLTRACLAHALDYDVRVLPQPTALALGNRLAQLCLEVVQTILRVQLEPQAAVQLFLDVCKGGAGLHHAGLHAQY
eukprot:6778728-Lingulodinium_polyedra.AAC.1